jgi:hypothetical protein
MTALTEESIMKSITPFLSLVLAATGFTLWQVLVPDMEARQKALFEGFYELERLGAYVVGEDGEMLGKISKGWSQDSLGNEYGAGSEYKTDGLFNKYSKYGSSYSSTSAFNDYATNPPKILVKKDGGVYLVGVLTTNPYAPTRGQRVNPYLLRAWLKSR